MSLDKLYQEIEGRSPDEIVLLSVSELNAALDEMHQEKYEIIQQSVRETFKLKMSLERAQKTIKELRENAQCSEDFIKQLEIEKRDLKWQARKLRRELRNKNDTAYIAELKSRVAALTRAKKNYRNEVFKKVTGLLERARNARIDIAGMMMHDKNFSPFDFVKSMETAYFWLKNEQYISDKLTDEQIDVLRYIYENGPIFSGRSSGNMAKFRSAEDRRIAKELSDRGFVICEILSDGTLEYRIYDAGYEVLEELGFIHKEGTDR